MKKENTLIFGVRHQQPEMEERIKYVFDFIQEHPLTEGKVRFDFESIEHSLAIFYGGNFNGIPHSTFFIPAQELVFNTQLPDFSNLKANCYSKRNIEYRLTNNEVRSKKNKEFRIYSVETSKKAPNHFFSSGAFQFDIIETIFFHISRIEEYYCEESKKDKWGMMQEELQFLVRNGIQQSPVVDHLVFAFLSVLGVIPAPLRTKIRMSHDIDVLRKFRSPFRLIKDVIKLIVTKKRLLPVKKLYHLFIETKKGRQKDPFDTFNWLFDYFKMDSDRIIYIMAGGITKYDNHYHIDAPELTAVLKKAMAEGYKIGLHPSYASCSRLDLIQKEKEILEERIGQPIYKSRQHYLRFSWAETIKHLQQAGIREDATLGFQNIIGFRCGTGFPFRLYDLSKNSISNLMENPMVVMDAALLKVSDFDINKTKKMLWGFLAKNQQFTQISFNFHNSIFDNTQLDASAFEKLYIALNNKFFNQ